MSSFVDDEEYIFDHATSNESSFIYGVRADGYNELSFMGALEADAEIVIDLENEQGFYGPRIDNSELAELVSGIQEYADEAGFDTYNFCFREQGSRDWRSVIASVWNTMEAEESTEQMLESSESSKTQIADGGSETKPEEALEGHSRPQQAYTKPVGVDNSRDEYRFDASEGWGWD